MTETEEVSEEVKRQIAKMSLAEFLWMRAEQKTRAEFRDPKNPEAEKKAVQMMHDVAENPRLLDKYKRTAQGKIKNDSVYARIMEEEKKKGNGLPADCLVFFFDFESVKLKGDPDGFKSNRITQWAFLPYHDTSEEPGTTLVSNVNPQIDWKELDPRLRRYAKDAWDCEGIVECAALAPKYPKFTESFHSLVAFVEKQAVDQNKQSSEQLLKHIDVCLVGFNSQGSDMRTLKAELDRYKLKWPDHFSVWLWDTQYELRRALKPQGKKWNLALLYNIAFNKSMPNAHKAYDDAKHLMQICGAIWPRSNFDSERLCQMMSTLTTGIHIVYDHNLELAFKFEKKAATMTSEQQTLSLVQLEAQEIGGKPIKKGIITGLGDKHAKRLRVQHKATIWAHLFVQYENDQQFVDKVIRKGVTDLNMAKKAEAKLTELARTYAGPRDVVRAQDKQRQEKKQIETEAELKHHKERLAFLSHLKSKVSPMEVDGDEKKKEKE